ncbi:MAG: helix-turn-helix domain-containing protein [Gaiellales bacterium]
MSITTDRLTRFLDVLEETLDDRRATPELVASQLHLSRFHVDRLVSAAIGEPPVRLRRRILLERAAHRLTTTEDDLLAVSLDAGYASHEAFTRAFSRAYGRPPSRWRLDPGSYRIGAAARVHFNPPGGLSLPAQKEVTAMDLLTRMIEHHVWLVGEMVTRAESLDAETLDRPVQISVEGIDDHPTLRSLLSRLIGQLAMWDASIQQRTYDFAVERDECVGSMRRRLAEAGPAFLADVRAIVEEGRLDETFVDTTCDPPAVFTYGGVIAHVLTFAAHRRTLVCGALADAGAGELGAGDPMRWVAEHA